MSAAGSLTPRRVLVALVLIAAAVAAVPYPGGTAPTGATLAEPTAPSETSKLTCATATTAAMRRSVSRR